MIFREVRRSLLGWSSTFRGFTINYLYITNILMQSIQILIGIPTFIRLKLSFILKLIGVIQELGTSMVRNHTKRICMRDQQFYYQFNVMIAAPNKRQSLPSKTNDHPPLTPNYKELYQQCKKNVAIFMKKVDNEISTILNNHQKEKKVLKQEIQSLKEQLRQRKYNSFAETRNPSIKSFTHNRQGSSVHDNSTVSVSREMVDECLSKFTGLQLKSQASDNKIGSGCSILPKKPTLKKHDSQKENSFLPPNLATIENDLPSVPLQSLTNIPQRSNRLKEKKRSSTIEVDSVKDVLKKMGDKTENRTIDYFSYRQNESKNPMVKVISPELFSARTSRN